MSSPSPTQQGKRLSGRQDFDSFVVDGKIKPQEMEMPGFDSSEPDEEPLTAPKTLSGIRDLMSAVHGVEQALHEERVRNQNLRDTLAQLKAKHESDTQALTLKLKQAEEKAKTLEIQSQPRIENEKNLQLQVATLTEQANRLRSELERHFLEKSEEKTKLRFEMQLLQNTQQYNTQRCTQLEASLEESRRQAERIRLDFELHRREALQKESRLKQALESAQADNEKFEQRIVTLNQELRALRAHEEQALHHRQENEDLKKQLRETRAKFDEIFRSFESEKHLRSQAEQELDSERKEKHSLLGFLRAAELKLAEAEGGFGDYGANYGAAEPSTPSITAPPAVKAPASASFRPAKKTASPPPFQGFDHLSREEAEDIVSKLILPSLHPRN